jgi:hypothetical protein
MSQNSKNQGFSYYLAWQQKDDRRIRIQIHSADFWIRIQEAQKHVDPVDQDPDSDRIRNTNKYLFNPHVQGTCLSFSLNFEFLLIN